MAGTSTFATTAQLPDGVIWIVGVIRERQSAARHGTDMHRTRRGWKYWKVDSLFRIEHNGPGSISLCRGIDDLLMFRIR